MSLSDKGWIAYKTSDYTCTAYEKKDVKAAIKELKEKQYKLWDGEEGCPDWQILDEIIDEIFGDKLI